MPPPSAYAARTGGSVEPPVMPRKPLAEPLLHRVGESGGDAISFRSVRGDDFEVALGTRGIEGGAIDGFDRELALAGNVGVGPAADLHRVEEIPRLGVAESRGVRAHVVPRRLDVAVLWAGPLYLEALAREPPHHLGDEPGRGCVDDAHLRLGIRHEPGAGRYRRTGGNE